MLEQMDTLTDEMADLVPDLDRDIRLSDNALTVLRKRYLLHDADGEIIETPSEMFWRVARVVAAPPRHRSAFLRSFDLLLLYAQLANLYRRWHTPGAACCLLCAAHPGRHGPRSGGHL